MKTIRIFFAALFLTAMAAGCSDPMDEFTPTQYGDSGGPILVQSEQNNQQKHTGSARSEDGGDVKDYGGPIN